MINQLDTFLRLLFPWETEHQQLYKAVMWRFVPPVGTNFQGVPLANYAAQSFDDLKRLITSRQASPQADMWIALGTERLVDTSKQSKDGFYKAIRKIPNVVSHKSIYLDVDVKDTGYPTTADAVSALIDFIKASSLPSPTMIVFSGSGGFHAYWCTDVPMQADAWKILATALRDAALAFGLKFDPQVTVNAAGVLRIPTTHNWKDPNNVNLVKLHVPADEKFPVYTYQQLSSYLTAHIGAMSAIQQVQTATAGNSSRVQNFTSGVTTQAAPIALADVAAACPLVADTLARGGHGDAEPLWNMLILLSSFTDDPVQSAHDLSSGDPRYTQAETDRKLQEKISYRAMTNAGWPTCATFNSLSSACKTCPLFAQQKSPLNFANRSATAAPGAAPAINDDMIPLPYFRGVDGHIYTTVLDKEGNSQSMDLFDREIMEAGIDRQNNLLMFKTLITREEHWVSVPVSTTNQTASVTGALAKAPSGGVQIQIHKRKKVEEFILAWITHLQKQRKFISAQTYGWSDNMEEFTFGEFTYSATGVEKSNLGKSYDRRFREVGDLHPWQAAMALVYGKPWLEAIVASSFAAPLAALFGGASPVLSVYSAESGVGKSTAMQLAQSVWGHPVSGMSSLDDTENSVKKKIADLKSLPAYWDELITADAAEKVVNLVFAFTQGKAKSRLTQNSEQMEANTFTTMFTISSNHGVSGGVYAGTNGTEAGGLRVFEVEAMRVPTTHKSFEAGHMMAQLTNNFGCAGAVYAKMIMANKTTIRAMMDKISEQLEAKHGFTQKERFWRTCMTLLLTGATLANAAKLTTLNIAGLAHFLGDELVKQRRRLGSEAGNTMSSNTSVLDLLNRLQGELQGRHLLHTDIVPMGGLGGRPPVVQIIDTDVTKLQGPWMQVGSIDGRIRLQASKFDGWLRKEKLNTDQVIRMLGQYYTIQKDRFTIGAGVPMLNASANGLTGRSTCYDLTPISSGSIPGSP